MTNPAQVLGEIVDLSGEEGASAIAVELMADDAGPTLVLWKARRVEGAYRPSGPVLSIPLGDVAAVFYAVARVHEAAERAEEAGQLHLDPT